MFNKYELVGVGVSVALMSLALWLIRLETMGDSLAALQLNENQSGTVLVGADGQSANLQDAIKGSAKGGTIANLIVDDVVVGEGDKVDNGDTVTVHYIGTLQNGQQFDSSYDSERPFTFTVGNGQVIKGWDEGLLGMKVGGKRILVIPSELGYGKTGGGPIPANATLVFAVELLSIK